jgi:rubrerythrin
LDLNASIQRLFTTKEGTMDYSTYEPRQLEELLYQALETEIGGIEIYTRAVECAINPALRTQWQEYLAQTRNHRRVLTNVFEQLGLDVDTQTPGRKVVAHLGQALAAAIDMASAAGDPDAAQIVAAECVVLAETKDHQNWELLGRLALESGDDSVSVLKQAYEAVEKEEDHHLYHTKGWARELWFQALGLAAVLPPPEELRHVETAMGAAHAEQSRERMLGAIDVKEVARSAG